MTHRTPADLTAADEADFWDWLIDQWENDHLLVSSEWDSPTRLIEGDEFVLLGQPAILLARTPSTVTVGHFDRLGVFRETALAAATLDALLCERLGRHEQTGPGR